MRFCYLRTKKNENIKDNKLQIIDYKIIIDYNNKILFLCRI